MQDNEKVVQIRPTPYSAAQSPVTDFWFAQVDVRLGRIEKMIRRLEWQVWAIVCGSAALLLIEALRTLTPN